MARSPRKSAARKTSARQKNGTTQNASGDETLKENLNGQSFLAVPADEFGRRNSKVLDVTRIFGGKQHRGKSINTIRPDDTIVNEIYVLPAAKGSRLLVLQDHPPDGKAVSDEAKKALELLSKSLRDTKAAVEKSGLKKPK